MQNDNKVALIGEIFDLKLAERDINEDGDGDGEQEYS